MVTVLNWASAVGAAASPRLVMAVGLGLVQSTFNLGKK